MLESIAEVVTTPPSTVVLKMSHPDPAILQALATFNAGIMSEKLMMASPGDDLEAKSKSFAERPIGSGPFMLTSWTHNSEMVLSRNPHYWKPAADGKPLPYLDKIRFLIIPDDATRILKLKAGEIDGTEFVPFSRVAELKADPKVNMVLYPSAKVIYFNLNNRPTFKDGSKNPMADVRVRQALNYATDKQAMIQVLSYGVGAVQQTFMPSSTPYAYTKGAPYPYDPAKAKKLLAEAGYPNGFEVTSMALAGNVDDVTQLSALQQMWGDVGVKVKIEQLESATRLTRFKAGEYQMRTSLWTNDINDPNEITSYFAYYPTVEGNRSGYRNEAVEKLFLDSQKAMDPKKREARLHRAAKTLHRRCAHRVPARGALPDRAVEAGEGFRADPAWQQRLHRHAPGDLKGLAMDVLMRVAQRLLQIVPTVALVAVLMFVLMRLLPGDPAIQLLGDRADRREYRPAAPGTRLRPIGRRAVLDLSRACRHAAPWQFDHAACAGDAAHRRAAADHADADGDGGSAGAADRGSAGLHCGACAREASSTSRSAWSDRWDCPCRCSISG